MKIIALILISFSAHAQFEQYKRFLFTSRFDSVETPVNIIAVYQSDTLKLFSPDPSVLPFTKFPVNHKINYLGAIWFEHQGNMLYISSGYGNYRWSRMRYRSRDGRTIYFTSDF